MGSQTKIRSDPFRGFFYALTGTLLVSTNFVTAKYGLAGFNPETFSLIWSGAAASYAFAIVLASRQTDKIVLPARCTIRIALMGVAAGASMILAWKGLARLDPSFASFLWRFQPVLAILLGVFLLRERLSMREIFPITVMVIGGLLSTIGRWNIVGIGTVLTILACLAVTLQMLIAKTESANIHPNILAFYRVAIAAIVIAVWTCLLGKADFNVEASYWVITLLGAFLGPCASFFLTFRSYRYWELSRASMVKTIQPLFVLPMAYVIFGRIPTGSALFGGLLILVGALWLSWVQLRTGQTTKNRSSQKAN